jgi:WD40 repeat protein/mono/diheme cytochrome c family protein
MNVISPCRWSVPVLPLLLLLPAAARADKEDPAALARKARAVLEANCHRCHGKDGAVEGGFNYVVDLDRLLVRHKVVAGNPDQSPLFRRVAAGKMPPPGEGPRPSADDIAVLRRWIEAGAPPLVAAAKRPFVSDAEVCRLILADLDGIDKRSRRFTRYFTLTHLANAGLGDDELQTYRNALAKLLNSLSWHPRITVPRPADPEKTILRIDLRDFVWDANLWNRILADYPYGVFPDTATARACSVATATRLPCIHADWFVATASRPPLYQDLLQLPNNSPELERQLRIDVPGDIQQERVARAGFNGSGISRNNRLIERHDSVHGAYWRTYDFDAVPQNLVDRPNLLPDRRNLFAYPLGPGVSENLFQHAGGEIIFNLPNGLQGYMLVNAVNERIDKGPLAIVSDPKRPDRAVETGISCMGCHYAGIHPKTDQIRAHVEKNPRLFSRADAELIKALYVPEAKMKALMDGDAERFRKALGKTGNKVTTAEPVMTCTLRYEADIDLVTAAAEAGLPAAEFRARLLHADAAVRNLGALKLPGGTVARQVFIQSFSDVVKDFRLGLLFDSTLLSQALPDNTGDLDPLEAQSSPANGLAFSADGRRALIASPDRSVRLWDVEAERDLRRFIGHTASVWSVAFSPDGSRALSGSADTTVRLWDVDSGRELRRLDGHTGLVTCVAFSPDGRKALSGGYDHTVILWDLDTGKELRRWEGLARYVNCLAFVSDERCLIGGENVLHLIETETGQEVRRLDGHTDSVVGVAVAPDGRRALSASDDGTARLWDLESGHVLRTFPGHGVPVKSVAFAPDGRRALSGNSDRTVSLWDVDTGQELRPFRGNADSVIGVGFSGDGRQVLAGSRAAAIRGWDIGKAAAGTAAPPRTEPPRTEVRPPAPGPLRPGRVIPVGGTVGSLLLAPDRTALYYLNLTDTRLGRVDLATMKRDHELRLLDGTEALSLTPDGTTLYAVVPGRDGKLQVIDARSLELRKTLAIPGVAYDVAAGDNGVVYLSGGSGDWTDVIVLDADRGTVLARWGGVWTRSLLQLAPDQKRLYVSTQGVTPGLIEGLSLPARLDAKPTAYRSPAAGKHPLGGPFSVTPDGKYLLCRTGTVLRLTGDRDTDLQHAATLEPFLAAAVDVERGAVLTFTADGRLERYSYPEFKPQGGQRLGIVAYQAACLGKQGQLYVAGFDPRALAANPRARGFGDIFVYDLKDLPQARAK